MTEDNQSQIVFVCHDSKDTPCLYYNKKFCDDKCFCHSKVAQVNRMILELKKNGVNNDE